ncbi:MAG: glycosyltransferase family 4 protein [Candidatus Peribacter sp.]|nr:glycosyltransferase family 4 protein [Candidatus Peribacter sp.]
MAGRTLHLLFLDQYGDIGGGQRILLDLVSAARERGWRIDVLCPPGPFAEAVRATGAGVHALAVPPMRSGPKSLWVLARALIVSRRAARAHRELAQQSDLIVVNGPRTLAIARTWVREFHKPALLYLHGVYGRLESMLIRSFLALPRTAAIAPSPLVAAPFARLTNVRTISNWVSREFIEAPANPGRLRQALKISDTRPIVLVPGRFSPNKGQRLVLEASNMLADISCHFVFAGAPLFEQQGKEVEEELRESAERSPDRIHVVHWQESMTSLYDGADIVIVPSVWEEPFGLTAIEAMARNRPLIVTDRGMLPEIADQGKAARVTKADAAEIAAALREYFKDPVSWESRTKAARERVEALYHPELRQQDVLQVVESLCVS